MRLWPPWRWSWGVWRARRLFFFFFLGGREVKGFGFQALTGGYGSLSGYALQSPFSCFKCGKAAYLGGPKRPLLLETARML